VPSAADLLLPRPRELRETGEALLLPRRVTVRSPTENPSLRPAARRISQALEECGLEAVAVVGASPGAAPAPEIELALIPHRSPHREAYRLLVTASGARIEGDDEAGLFYGAVTLSQWLRIHHASPPPEGFAWLPGIEVEDRPDFAHRGALLDVSRNRVPRMEGLCALVDRMAGCKLNQLQLYTEHTFAYRAHEVVWRHASPFTAEEIKQLDRYCSERFIELVPNQNSFGHMHRWLTHPAYRHLAERPEGVRHPFGESAEPFSLCPIDPGSLDLVEELWDELLPQFTSRQGNAGLDETFDLGSGRSAEECARRGTGRVYLDFLLGVRRVLLERGRRMQFWGDMALAHPDLISALPRDVIPLAWGYEADHPFEAEVERFAEAGLTHYVCPGTSSWNSLGGRADNALANLARAAEAGRASGAAGYLITDWGDHGHLQPPSVSGLGWIAGAARAWAAEARGAAPDWPALLDLHFFEGENGLGEAALALARIDVETGVRLKNGSVLFRLLLHAREDLTHSRFEHLTTAGLDRAGNRLAEIGDHLVALPRSPTQEHLELSWVASLLSFSCRLGAARLERGREAPLGALPRAARRRLRREIEPLVEALPALWLATSRPGGLEASVALLARIAAGLR